MPGFPVVTGNAAASGSAVIPGRTTVNTRRYTPADYAGTEKRRRDSCEPSQTSTLLIADPVPLSGVPRAGSRTVRCVTSI
jgi:hypothetical protein